MRRDVAIIVKAARLYIKDSELREANEFIISIHEIFSTACRGFSTSGAARRERAVAHCANTRGSRGLTHRRLAKAETRERFSSPGLAAPKAGGGKALDHQWHIRTGTASFLKKYQIAGTKNPTGLCAATEYDAFVKSECFPSASRLRPPARHLCPNLEASASISAGRMTERAHRAFTRSKKR